MRFVRSILSIAVTLMFLVPGISGDVSENNDIQEIPLMDWSGVDHPEYFDNGGSSVYHNYSELTEELHQIAADFPFITKLISIGQSVEGREIWALKISDNPDIEEDDEPELYFNANHHSREWITIEICMYIANFLTGEYGTNSTVTDIVDNR